jgi:hypothetical protein
MKPSAGRKLHSGPSYQAVIASIRTAPNPNDHSHAEKKGQRSRNMETLTIKSPADLLSFIGHSLGFWPQEAAAVPGDCSRGIRQKHDPGPARESNPRLLYLELVHRQSLAQQHQSDDRR